MDDVEHITSKAIQVSQNSAPNIQYPVEHEVNAMNVNGKNKRVKTLSENSTERIL